MNEEFTINTSHGDKYGPAMEITEQAEADAYFKRCVRHMMSCSGKSRAEAEEIERGNLGYYAGYYSHETRARVEILFRCQHPVFGSIEVNGPPSAEKVFRDRLKIAINRIVLIVALLAGGQALSAEPRWKPTRLAVHAAVEAYLKANVNDPRRLEIVRISKELAPTARAYKFKGGWMYRDERRVGIVQKGLWEPIGRRGWAVAVRFRATNRLGALVLADKVFCISGGVVFDWMNLGDFKPTRPKKRSDPFTDAFMKLAR